MGQATVYVMVHKVALTLLRKGIFNIKKIDIIVFDEWHHTRSEHPYNLIMREFYFYGLDYEKDESERYEERPFILGLTASPIKSKIKQSSISSFKLEMMDEIKDLCANLNSKIVSVDINQIDQSIRIITSHIMLEITGRS